MNRGAWQAIVHGFAKSRTQLSDYTYSNCFSEGAASSLDLVA